jgi:GcrA cell cycle regulator
MSHRWSEDSTALLQNLAASKLTWREIANRMTRRFRVAYTIDMVKRKIDRLGLSKNRIPVQRWTDERVALLRELAAKKLTMREIARQMTDQLGVPHTKDIVKNQMGRLGLSLRQIQEEADNAGFQAADVPTTAPVAQPQGRALSNLEVEQRAFQDIMLMVLPAPKHCQYPFGQPGRVGFRFCGDATVPGKAYCEEHCKNCFVRVPPVNREGSRSYAA